MGLWNRLGNVISSGWNKERNAVSHAVNAVKSGVGNAYNATKEGVKKGWNATKDFASKHAETIGNVAVAGLSAYNPALGAAAGLIGSHFGHDKSGFGRFMKGLAGGVGMGGGGDNLSSQLKSQSNATNESNGHVATGYSLSSTGNYNGRNRQKSWVL